MRLCCRFPWDQGDGAIIRRSQILTGHRYRQGTLCDRANYRPYAKSLQSPIRKFRERHCKSDSCHTRPISKAVRWLAICTLLLLGGTQGSACTLKSPDFKVGAGRLAAFDLSIRHGAIASVRNTPVGWQITIDNDPSWVTAIQGHAVVGAAFLPLADLPSIMTIVPEPGYTCSQLNQRGFLLLKLQLYDKDQMEKSTVDHLNSTD